MKNGDETLWTIEELGDRVALELGGQSYDGVPSGRVRDVPDLRTIRYYTTLGLLDRAAAMRGRTALYGPRHLLQLVLIKRLQARGTKPGRNSGAGRRPLRLGIAAARRGGVRRKGTNDNGVARSPFGVSPRKSIKSRPGMTTQARTKFAWKPG